QGTARLSPKREVLSDYLLWGMRSSRVLRQAEIESKGTTFREITLAALRGILLPIPPPPEQGAIAAALSDADALMSGLEQLIAKKRNIKLASMQQLLTGRIRLPGFHGKWEVKPLGSICRPQKGELITEAIAIPGEYPVIAGGQEPSYFHNRPNR